MKTTEAQIERLNSAHQTALYDARAFVADASLVHAQMMIRATNVLLECCIECGMGHDYPDHEAWAAERVTRWLVEA